MATPDPEDVSRVVRDHVAKARSIERTVKQRIETLVANSPGRLVGLEYSVKSVNSLTHKIRETARYRKIRPDEVAVNDALRFRVVVAKEDYAETVGALASQFRADWQMDRDLWRDNWDSNNGYRALNTTWELDGIPFEVQFHTDESAIVANRTHPIYRATRDAVANDDSASVQRLRAELRAEWSGVTRPPGSEGLP